jgi:hypothetical protein
MRVILKSPGVKSKIIELNTQNQLFLKGIDSKGKKLKSASFSAILNDEVYAAMTIALKEAKAQPTDRVTLKDTGDFYESFNVKATDDALIITANTMKEDNDLMEVWGDDIIGLTDENLQVIINMARFAVQEYVRKTIQAA